MRRSTRSPERDLFAVALNLTTKHTLFYLVAPDDVTRPSDGHWVVGRWDTSTHRTPGFFEA